ncbi:serpin family protein [Polyangium sp. y55x31]|uniref:serpin family protein n=1 Tax=Polyangium sp. y55x31 TaxID=3042688 RepID=UPI0024829334|nr:serpin family protein [Polyangium sp. y55x31]MDI1484300.1 serpin family protein [Polyangium sp. y55x31]
MRTLPVLSLLLSLSALACSSSAPPEPPGANNTGDCHDPNTPGCVVTSGAQRITSPNVPSADLDALVDGNTAFAADMYKALRSEPGNLFYSPHSISSALAMTWAGARGQTETDMAKALHFTLPQAQLHPAFNALDLALASRGKDAKGSDGQGFRLNVANAVWGQVKYPFEASFLDVLALNYGAGMNIVDFVEAQDQALSLINGWVEKKTEGKIKDILAPDSIDASTRLVLTNAVYFNAAWRTPFEEENTQNASFTTDDGATVTVPMMQGYIEAPYGKGADYAAVELPYDGDELSMVLVLPDDLDAFESSLDAARLSEVVGALSEHSVDTRLPKFKFESKFSLVKPLDALGMGIAFTGGADFSGINGTGGLAISDVIHQSFVSVNEAGTEAAAATAVIVGETSAPEPAAITFDKPFLFFIRDIATKSVLFVGRVADPS